MPDPPEMGTGTYEARLRRECCMGWIWTTVPMKREDLMREYVPAEGWDSEIGRVRFEPRKWVADGCWGVVTATNAAGVVVLRVVAIVVCKQDRNGTAGYKGICTECDGPYYDGCPASLVREVVPIYEGGDGGKYAREFRARVLEADAAKARLRERLVPGAVLRLPEGCKPGSLRVVGRENRSVIGLDDDGRRFRVGPALLARCTVEGGVA